MQQEKISNPILQPVKLQEKKTQGIKNYRKQNQKSSCTKFEPNKLDKTTKKNPKLSSLETCWVSDVVKNRVPSNGRLLFFASQFPFNVKSKILQCIPQLSLENGSKLVSMKERAKSFFWYWCLRTLFLCFLHRNFVVKFPQEKLQRVWKRKMVNTLECRSAADFSTAMFLQRCRHFPLQWRYQKRFIIHASLGTSVMPQ